MVRAVAASGEFLGSVGNGVGRRGRACDFTSSFHSLGALTFFLHRAEGVESCNSGGMFLPSQIPTLEVFVEFRLLGFEQSQFTDVGEGDDTVGKDLAVVLERAAEFEDFADGFQPPLAGNQHPGIALST